MTNPYGHGGGLLPSPVAGDSGFRRAIALSLGLHLILFIAFAVRAVFYPSQPLTLEDAIRVDIVALPDKVKTAELPPTSTAPEKTEPPPPPPEKVPATESIEKQPPAKVAKPAPLPVKPETPKVSLDRAKRDQAAALKRLEALERIEKMHSNETNAKAAQAQAPTAPTTKSSVQVRGNVLSAGSSLKGLQRLEHQSYLATVKQLFKRHWNLPQWLANANLSASVRVYVDAGGNVVKKQLTRSSGNPDFDERVLRSIEASSPLAPPPGDLVNILSVDGLDAEFP